ncbi:hypothetical protein F5Y17DRAFT_240615 [Xylariaceae sp. FL0594]|nr:hypothetical protein F5Y17DRAFT_240615 [Xylariaceae sp. FL0594]
MCHYRRFIFTCNHGQISSEPMILCANAKKDTSPFSSSSPKPEQPTTCEEISTHARSTVRVPRPCDVCARKKAATDAVFADVKARLTDLRKHLEEAYGECLKHMDDAGVTVPASDLELPVVDDDDHSGSDAGTATASSSSPLSSKKVGGLARTTSNSSRRTATSTSKSTTTTSATTPGKKGKETKADKGETEGGKAEEEEEDPVAKFLKKKMSEKDSHLMMLGSYL